MSDYKEAEVTALKRIEADLSSKGYTIIRDPQSRDIPDFLQGFQPDALAVGIYPQYVVEIVSGNSGRVSEKKQSLQKLFENNPDWKLLVQHVQAVEILLPVDRGRIENAFIQAKMIFGSERQAAFLLAWAALEAATRRLEPSLAAQPSQHGGIANLLVSQGYFTQEDGMRLRELGKMRNEITHGALDLVPSVEEMDVLVAFGERLLAYQSGDPIAAE